MRSVLFYLYNIFRLFMTLPKRLGARAYRKRGDIEGLRLYTTQVAQHYAKPFFDASGSTIDIRGLEHIPKDDAVLFVSNHQGNFDYAIFLGYITKPKGFISMTGAKYIPIVRKWMVDLDCVFIDRDNIKQATAALRRGVELLKSGWSMVIFPEGRRSKGNLVGPFKAGSFKLATKSKVPIIPVTLDGTYKIMEANRNWIIPSHVRVTIHPMIETANLEGQELKNLPARVQTIIASALEGEQHAHIMVNKTLLKESLYKP